jgi:hypothetical protein
LARFKLFISKRRRQKNLAEAGEQNCFAIAVRVQNVLDFWRFNAQLKNALAD